MKEAAPTVVMKFGGTSVGDISRIHRVADIIARYRKETPRVRIAAVVSAMAGETNRLVALAKSCVPAPNPREMDVLLATGEQVTIALLAMALNDRGIPSKSFTAQQARIRTDNRHTKAHIDDLDAGPITEVLEAGGVPVVAGFQGVDDMGDVTTLGRGGSDITAVALASALQAETCFIYTDVAGVYSADPRMVRNARLLEKVCHDEMLEMASLGAKVLHSRSVYFAMRYRVPMVVLSTFEDGIEAGRNGTWIVPEEELVEKPIVTGITYRNDEARITVDGMPQGIEALSCLFEELAEADVFVDMISQTVASNDRITVSFTVPDENSATALDVVRRVIPDLHAQGASITRDIAKVSVVGVGMKYHTGVAGRMFRALASEKIDIQMIGTSEIKISVLVPRKYCEVAVRALHDEFIPDGAGSPQVEG